MFGLQITNIFYIFSYFVIFIPLCSANGVCIGLQVPDKVLKTLYSTYKDALNIGDGTVLFRRVFTNSKKYQIHVMKLNEVNGNKRHNLLIKEDNSTNPLIYINNPVETKLPNAYLTFEEFKKELTDRVLRLREDFNTNLKKGNKIATQKTRATSNKANKEEAMLKLFLNDLITVNKQPKPIDKTKVSRNSEKPMYRAKTIIDQRTHTSTLSTVSYTTRNLKVDIVTPNITQINNNITQQSYSNETTETAQKVITENSTVAESVAEASLESPKVTIVTENPIEPEVTDLSEQYVATDKYEVDSTAKSEDITSPVEVTETIRRSTKPSKPLVWMEGENE